MSELSERLERLATRGTRRGADAVLDAALDDARLYERRNGHGGPTEGVDGAAADVPPAVSMDEARPRRRPWRTAITAGGLAALLGVGTLGITSLLGSGGARSPEAAAERLADALEHEDLLAAVAALAPNEVATLAETVDEVRRRAEEFALVDDAARPLAGIDFELSDLSFRTEELAPGYVKVYVDGFVLETTVRTDGLAARVRKALRADEPVLHSRLDAADIARDAGVFVVAVQHDGGWYVSPAYTVLEYTRSLYREPPAAYGSGRAAIATLGAESPEALIERALHAWSEGNWDELVRLVPPDELPLYDYRDMLRSMLTGAAGPRFTIDRLSVDADVSGDTATVSIDAAGRLRDGGWWRVDRNCPSIDAGAKTSDRCGTGYGGVLPIALDRSLFDAKLTVVQREGRWFLSVSRTLFPLVARVAGDLTSDDVAVFLGLYDELPVDATLALGRPANLVVRGARPTVFTYEGTAGEEVVATAGLAETGVPADVYGVVLGPDGRALDDAWGLFDGTPVRLPETGTYRIVVFPYDPEPVTVTLWDRASAPAGAFAPSGPCDDSELVSCGAAVATTATTAVAGTDGR